MKRFAAAFVLATAALAWALPASARNFVQDQAQMFSPATVAALNQRIGSFNAQTGKEILVVTVPTLNGADISTAASAAAQQQGLNGVIVYIAKNDRRDIILPGRAEVQAGWFTRDTVASIRQAMEAQFKAEDFDGGITTAVGSILGIYRSHLSSLQRGGATNAVAANAGASSGGGVHIGMFWWIVIIGLGFLIVRSIMRARSAPRYYPPVQGTPGQPGAPGTPMPGAPMAPGGYPMGGYGMGGFGGGGSFWSGLLGGLGGAWLGNEMFGNRGGFGGGMMQGGPPDAGGGWGANGGDAGGWGNDAGQTDMSGGSAGDFGGGGFGDFGGGGGFGGGDSGGGGW